MTSEQTKASRYEIRIGKTEKDSYVKYDGKKLPYVKSIKAEVVARGLSKVMITILGVPVEVDPGSVETHREGTWK